MKVYSQLFHTLYDEQVPPNPLFGCGVHHSVLRATYLVPNPAFHDFAIVWDADHDERIIWVAEQLYVRGLLRHVDVLGERKAVVSVYSALHIPLEAIKAMKEVAASTPSDSFALQSYAEDFDSEYQQFIGSVSADDQRIFLQNLDVVWDLGSKPIEYSDEAFTRGRPVRRGTSG